MFSEFCFFIKIYRNEVEIFNLLSGRSLKRNSNLEFSSKRLIIADYEIAEMFLKELMRELISFEPKKIFTPKAKILFQVMDLYDGGLSKTELRLIRDIGERLGAQKILIFDGSIQVSIEKALNDLEEL